MKKAKTTRLGVDCSILSSIGRADYSAARIDNIMIQRMCIKCGHARMSVAFAVAVIGISEVEAMAPVHTAIVILMPSLTSGVALST
jgi:hypothetical protein